MYTFVIFRNFHEVVTFEYERNKLPEKNDCYMLALENKMIDLNKQNHKYSYTRNISINVYTVRFSSGIKLHTTQQRQDNHLIQSVILLLNQIDVDVGTERFQKFRVLGVLPRSIRLSKCNNFQLYDVMTSCLRNEVSHLAKRFSLFMIDIRKRNCYNE